MNKLTKAQKRLYDRVKSEGSVLVRELSATENKMGHRLKAKGLLKLDGLISSRGPFNQPSQNVQCWVLTEYDTPAPSKGMVVPAPVEPPCGNRGDND